MRDIASFCLLSSIIFFAKKKSRKGEAAELEKRVKGNVKERQKEARKEGKEQKTYQVDWKLRKKN